MSAGGSSSGNGGSPPPREPSPDEAPPGAGDEGARPSAPGERSSAAPKRVTLQFAGPPLALPPPPDAASAPSGEGAGSGDLRLDTGEFHLADLVRKPVVAAAAERPDDGRLELDLEEIDGTPGDTSGQEITPSEPSGADGWGRLRDSGPAPARPRSVTPPTMARDDALDLVSQRSRPPSTPGLDLPGEMADRYALGDYTGALRVAELLLGRNPQDAKAQRCAESSRERLIQLHSARLVTITGASGEALGAQVPHVAVPEHEIRWLGLDHRQGFLLSRLDGVATIDDLVDLSGMSRLDVLRALVELAEAKAIRFDLSRNPG